MDRKFRRSRSPILRREEHAPSRDRYRKREKYRTSRSISPPPARRISRNRSRSPVDRKGHGGNRVNPLPSRILGVFGLSVHTSESHVRQIFSKFGPIDRLKVVYDSKTGRSRGFCFVYYQNTEDARAAKDQCSGMEIDRQRIRVDFSMTARAHSPTPGVYMGKPTRDHTDREQRERDRGEGDRDYNHHQNYSNSTSSAPNYRRRRSPSPQYRRRRNRSVSYSPRTR